MTEWQEVTLADLCERVTVGHVGKMSDEYVDEGVPFLRSQNVRPFVIAREGLLRIDEDFHTRLRKSALAAGDVVVVRTGYPGTAAEIPRDLDGANCADLVIITPSNDLNPYVLAAIFNSVWGNRQSNHSSSAPPNSTSTWARRRRSRSGCRIVWDRTGSPMSFAR